jgi:hypothetical protein
MMPRSIEAMPFVVSMKIDHDEFAGKLLTGATGTAASHPEAVKPAQ